MSSGSRDRARERLLAENEQLRNSLRTLEASQVLMSCLEPGEIFAVALDVLLGASGETRGLALFRRSLHTSDGMVFRGFDEFEVLRLREVLVLEKFLGRESFDAPRILDDGALHDVLAEAGVVCGSALAVPLTGPDTERGVLWVFGDRAELETVLRSRADMVRDHAELALRNAERYGQAKERAFVDDVTNVYNARFLLQATDREIQRAERYGKPLSVLFLDLDRFKRVNDEHGHLVGSQVLRKLSGVLQECIRQVDTLARYGGDEFTILLVDTGLDQAMAIAERIRRTVAETLFEGGGGRPVRLTISIGVAAYPAHGRGREALLDAADKSMYRAKSRGRDCCASASDLSED
ncbi:MAG: GGDEF domain-containing protein [Myxococcota bacterium]|nr:GGDEF domain-containing protein [Myxococcota bacterium]